MSSKDKKIYKKGLTTQEYSFKHALPIESLISTDSIKEKKLDVQHLAKKQLSEDQIIILKAYHDLNLLNIIDNEVRIYEEVRKLDFLYWVESKLNDLGFLFQENNE